MLAEETPLMLEGMARQPKVYANMAPPDYNKEEMTALAELEDAKRRQWRQFSEDWHFGW